MAAIWAGIDAGKAHHHCVAIDESGRRLLSRRVANDESELLELLADVLALDEEATWGIDLADGGAALAIGVLLNHDQPVHYISGRAIHRDGPSLLSVPPWRQAPRQTRARSRAQRDGSGWAVARTASPNAASAASTRV